MNERARLLTAFGAVRGTSPRTISAIERAAEMFDRPDQRPWHSRDMNRRDQMMTAVMLDITFADKSRDN